MVFKMMSGLQSSSASDKLHSSEQYEVEDGGRTPARTTNSNYGSVETHGAVLTSDKAKEDYSINDSSALLSGDETSVDVLSKTGYVAKTGTSAKKMYFLFALGAIVTVGISSFMLMPRSSTAPEMQAIGDALPTLEESIPLLTSGENAVDGSNSPIGVVANATPEDDANSASMSLAVATAASDDAKSISTQTTCDDLKTASAVATGLGAALFTAITISTQGLAGPIAYAALFTAGNALTNLWGCPGNAQMSYDQTLTLIKDVVNENDAEEIVDTWQDVQESLKLQRGNLNKISLGKLSMFKDRIESEVLNKARDVPLLVRSAEIMIAAMLQYEAIATNIMMRKSTHECDLSPDDCCDEKAGYLKLELDQLIGSFDNAYDELLEEGENSYTCKQVCDSYLTTVQIRYSGWVECSQSHYPNAKEAVLGTFEPFNTRTPRKGYGTSRCPYTLVQETEDQVWSSFVTSDVFAWWRNSQLGLDSLKKLQSKSKDDLKELCDRGTCPNENGLDCACSNDTMCGDGLVCTNMKCTVAPPAAGHCGGCNSRTPCQSGLVCFYNSCVTRQESYRQYPPC